MLHYLSFHFWFRRFCRSFDKPASCVHWLLLLNILLQIMFLPVHLFLQTFLFPKRFPRVFELRFGVGLVFLHFRHYIKLTNTEYFSKSILYTNITHYFEVMFNIYRFHERVSHEVWHLKFDNAPSVYCSYLVRKQNSSSSTFPWSTFWKPKGKILWFTPSKLLWHKIFAVLFSPIISTG